MIHKGTAILVYPIIYAMHDIIFDKAEAMYECVGRSSILRKHFTMTEDGSACICACSQYPLWSDDIIIRYSAMQHRHSALVLIRSAWETTKCEVGPGL